MGNADRQVGTKVQEMNDESSATASAGRSLIQGPPPSDKTFRLVLHDALASEAMGTLTIGVFLAGFAVELGAGNVAIGLLAAVPFAVQFLQLPAVLLVERLRARRAIVTSAAAIGRACSRRRALHCWGKSRDRHLDRDNRLVSGDGDRRLCLEFLDA